MHALDARVEPRIPDAGRRREALDVLHDHEDLFRAPARPTLTHDDLHHANLLLRRGTSGWTLAGPAARLT